jgi:hypothetical protein
MPRFFPDVTSEKEAAMANDPARKQNEEAVTGMSDEEMVGRAEEDRDDELDEVDEVEEGDEGEEVDEE